MFDEKLASSMEELGERLFSRGTIEDVFFFDPHPGQPALLCGQGIILASKFLLLCE
jgi:hypothetical protein